MKRKNAAKKPLMKSARGYSGDDEMSLPPLPVSVRLDAGPQAMGSEVDGDENPNGVLRFFRGVIRS